MNFYPKRKLPSYNMIHIFVEIFKYLSKASLKFSKNNFLRISM